MNTCSRETLPDGYGGGDAHCGGDAEADDDDDAHGVDAHGGDADDDVHGGDVHGDGVVMLMLLVMLMMPCNVLMLAWAK